LYIQYENVNEILVMQLNQDYR